MFSLTFGVFDAVLIQSDWSRVSGTYFRLGGFLILALLRRLGLLVRNNDTSSNVQ